MSKKKGSGTSILLGVGALAAAGGIGYLIWKKMQEPEPEEEMSGMGASRSPRILVPASSGCPVGYADTEVLLGHSIRKRCCMNLAIRNAFVTKPLGRPCTNPFPLDGMSHPSEGTHDCFHSPEYLWTHGCYPGTQSAPHT